ncbi:hypothetical protein D3C85_1278360 [compost metagenome]
MTTSVQYSETLPAAAHIYNALAEPLRTGGIMSTTSVSRKDYRRNASERSLRSLAERLTRELSRHVSVSGIKTVDASGATEYRIMANV